jgi:hypothetical protein
MAMTQDEPHPPFGVRRPLDRTGGDRPLHSGSFLWKRDSQTKRRSNFSFQNWTLPGEDLYLPKITGQALRVREPELSVSENVGFE